MCNGVAMWMDFHVNNKNCTSTGPTEPLSPGKPIQWDINSRQGIHLFNTQHSVQPDVGQQANKFKYSVTFIPKTGDFEFKFGVG